MLCRPSTVQRRLLVYVFTRVLIRGNIRFLLIVKYISEKKYCSSAKFISTNGTYISFLVFCISEIFR